MRKYNGDDDATHDGDDYCHQYGDNDEEYEATMMPNIIACNTAHDGDDDGDDDQHGDEKSKTISPLSAAAARVCSEDVSCCGALPPVCLLKREGERPAAFLDCTPLLTSPSCWPALPTNVITAWTYQEVTSGKKLLGNRAKL